MLMLKIILAVFLINNNYVIAFRVGDISSDDMLRQRPTDVSGVLIILTVHDGNLRVIIIVV